MHKIYIDGEGWKLLKAWAKEYPRLAYQTRPFFKKCELHLQEIVGIVHYVEHKSDRIKVSAKGNKELFWKLNVEKDGLDFERIKNKAIFYQPDARDIPDEVLDNMLDIVAKSYILANSYLFYGNIVENKKVVATGRNEDKYKVIIFRKYKDGLYAVHAGAHRSPEGVFSVRGHLRRYKTGKLVWIDEYLKGLNKDN